MESAGFYEGGSVESGGHKVGDTPPVKPMCHLHPPYATSKLFNPPTLPSWQGNEVLKKTSYVFCLILAK